MTETIHKRAKVYGPPGTGKTTYLLNLLEQAAKKYDPDRIGAVSLTNAAVEEMRGKVYKHTKVKPKHIRTIHSTCFNLLELNKNQVADKKIKEFNEAYPNWQMPLDTEIKEDEHYQDIDPHFSPQANKQRFNKIQLLRHAMVPEQEWEDQSLQSMYRDWKTWMAESGYVDFTEMLEMTLDEKLKPEIDILLVDEAQDISRLSINVLEMWARDCKSTVYVGDGDQAILKFAGAVPEAFINLDHTWMKVLDQSYRVSKKVHEYAMSIIRRAENREEISYKPTKIEGKIYGLNLLEPDLSLEGIHMILGRCNFHLNKWRTWLINKKIPFHNPYRPGDKAWNPLNTKVWRAAKSYNKLRDGKEIKIKEFKNMVESMRSQGNLVSGTKTHLDQLLVVDDTENFHGYDLFKAISLGIFTKEFISFRKPIEEIFKLKGQSGELLEKVEDIMREPKVIIGTIHCSPPDELILTTAGFIPISELGPEHRLASYHRGTNRLSWGGRPGPFKKKIEKGFPFTTKSQIYSGDLITIETSRTKTRVTPEHQVLIRFSPDFFNRYIVYLMQRGNWWRVGVCTSGHQPYKSGGLGGRLATEQADAGWILGIFKTRGEAIYEEARVQSLYGIPGLTFRSVSKDRLLTTKQLQSIHKQIYSRVEIRVQQLFKDFGLHRDWPLYTRGTSKVHKRNMQMIFATMAANLPILNGYVKVPVFPKAFFYHEPGLHPPELLTAKISKKKYIGEIYSLDVEPFHYYISGGAIVHNSVKGGECDHVWIDRGTSWSCIRACRESREAFWDEVRVSYVGVSRARVGVGLLGASGSMELGEVW